jgi:methylenetetrahydrofolate dehydrogenase (NADP+)/methenyltetrahydrofolate cyclohydrolase
MTQVLYGKPVADKVYSDLQEEIIELRRHNIFPRLVVILVGDDPASQIYVNNKGKACKKLGISHETIILPSNTPQSEIESRINSLNGDPSVNGILIQLPLPTHLNTDSLIEKVDPGKDVDGFHPMNVGRLLNGNPLFVPCTPAGIMEIMKYYHIKIPGKHAVVIGRSNIVGKPIANLLIQKSEFANATVTICHSFTQSLEEFTKIADILIVAAGRPDVVRGDMVKPGSIVIDVGINRIPDSSKKKGYKIVGDVDFDSVFPVVNAITPVPGGVGPMTIAMLMKNTVHAARLMAIGC